MTSKTTPRLVALLLVSSMALTSSCKKVCGDNLPQYSLSAGQRAWGGPFVANAEWRFRNAAGYERAYRITSAETRSIGSGGTSKISVCPTYYQEYTFSDFARTDSALTGYAKGIYHLQLAATVVANDSHHLLQWSYGDFSLPIDEAEAGQVALAPATFGGRTYPAVLACTSRKLAPLVLHLYLTKAEGVVAFDDEYGTLWGRL